MVKKILTALISIIVLAVGGYFLVQYYIEHIYRDPGAVNAREQRMTKEACSTLVSKYKQMDNYNTFVVCVNPSNGGYEYKTANGPVSEKDVTLEVALELEKMAAGTDGLKICLTRYDDVAPSEDQRREIIDALNPDAIIDIRLAADTDSKVFGTECFYRTDYYDYRVTNMELADIMERNLCVANEGLALGITEAPVECFDILNDRNIPACSVSLGYISSDTEGCAFTSTAYKKKLAEGLYNGINQVYITIKDKEDK